MEPDTAVPATRKERWSWYMYDFANTSFSVLMVTALFPLYFISLFVDAGLPEALGTAWWGYAGSITMLIIAISSPVLGAIADHSGSKKKFLYAYTILCVVFNALLFFATVTFLGPSVWVWAWVIFIIANIGFQGALPFYNAWLPEISTEENIGRIGGNGWAAGYVGALLTIIIALVSTLMLADQPTLPFLFGALFFGIFGFPAIMGLKNRPPKQYPGEEDKSSIDIGFSRVRKTLKEIRTYEGVPRFLVAYFLFSDAITTVIYYAAIFGQVVYGFSITDILIFFAVTQLAAIPGAFIFGWIGDKIGTKKTLIISLFIWIIALFIAFFGVPYGQIVWWIVGMIAGVGMGSSQSTARSMYGQFIPEEKKSEMYGFYALTGKFAAILGPFFYATIILLGAGAGLSAVDQHLYAMVALASFFVVGALVMIGVKQPVKGKTQVYIENDLAAGA